MHRRVHGRQGKLLTVVPSLDTSQNCIVCIESLTVDEPCVSCQECFSRSKSTWKSHLRCWETWNRQTCFYCGIPLVCAMSNNPNQSAARHSRWKQLRVLLNYCVFSCLVLVLFTSFAITTARFLLSSFEAASDVQLQRRYGHLVLIHCSAFVILRYYKEEWEQCIQYVEDRFQALV